MGSKNCLLWDDFAISLFRLSAEYVRNETKYAYRPSDTRKKQPLSTKGFLYILSKCGNTKQAINKRENVILNQKGQFTFSQNLVNCGTTDEI